MQSKMILQKVLLSSLFIWSQNLGVSSASGRKFLITFLENEMFGNNGPHPQCFTLTTTLAEDIEVQITSLDPDINFNTTVIINNTLSEYVCLDNSIQLKGTGLSKKVVQISAEDNISVMVHNVERHSADSYMAVPLEALGTDYYVVNYWVESEISVTASENDTFVTITFPVRDNPTLDYEIQFNGVTSLNPSDIVLTLQENEVFHMNMTRELTGVFVSSTKPIAVVSGNKKIQTSSERSSDHLAEQMPPVDTWGTNFTSLPSPGKTTTDIYTVLASTACTSVTVGNTTYRLETEGDWIRIHISSIAPTQIVSDKPVLVTKIIEKQLKVEPCMMNIVPQNQWLSRYTFRLPELSVKGGYLIVVVESQFKTSILLNTTQLVITNWIKVDHSNLSVGYIHLENAVYTLYLPDTGGRFAAYIQHSYNHFGYCTSLGKKLSKLNKDWTHSQDTIVCDTPTTSPQIETTEEQNLSMTETSTKKATTISNVTDENPINNAVSISDGPDICFTPNPQLQNVSVTDEVFLDFIEELKQHLKVVPTKTSQAIRKKISVSDPRPSSTSIGISLGIVMIVVLVMGILCADSITLIKDVRYGVIR